MDNLAIKVENVTKIYKLYDKPSDRFKESLGLSKKKKHKEYYALRGLDIEVKKGECVGIIGTNGAGKSTILKIITGVLNQTSGSVVINGRISALLELGAGFNSEYTGMENIYLNGMMLGYTNEEIEQKLESILSFADIGEFINQPVKTYSSGMFVRLAFAVAINIEPEILIVDEALSVGDVFFQAKCYRKFEELKNLGKTILLVSHDLGSINKYCDNVILLKQGKKIAEGQPKEIIDLYKKVMIEEKQSDAISEEDSIENNQSEISTNKNELWKSSMLTNNELIEYGNKKATIIDYGVFDKNSQITNTVNKLEEFKIKIKVRFNEEVKLPIFAFTIRDLKGNELCGTNTFIEDVVLDKAEKENEIIVTFKQNMMLQKGQYMLQLGCTGYEGDELVVYHRLYDVCCIQVISQKITVGYFDINSKVKLEKSKTI